MSELPHLGLHRDVPEVVYESWPAARSSVLKRFERSAAHAREAMLHPSEPTPALELGQAVHRAILEPDRFATEYVAAPKVDRRTTAGKAEWSAFQAEYKDHAILSAEDFALAGALRDAAWSHPLVAEILRAPGMNEVSACWIDGETGEACKARIDGLRRWLGRSLIVDVKTTKDASPSGFGREAIRYGYDAQMAHYRMGLANLAPMERGCAIVALEKDPPHCAVVYVLPEEVIALGERKVRRWLARYAEARRTDTWPGYATELQTLELPAWAWKEDEDE